jgi:hypothetical protein
MDEGRSHVRGRYIKRPVGRWQGRKEERDLSLFSLRVLEIQGFENRE